LGVAAEPGGFAGKWTRAIYQAFASSGALARRVQIGVRAENALSGDAAGSEVDGMPVISKFYGIVIGMFVAPAFSARFHAIYGDSELVVAINPLRIIDGHAPQRVCDLVMEWAAQHQRELLEAWNRLTVAQAPPRIAPLQ
jgi:hypothetical protein